MRRERFACLTIAVLLVVFRSALATYYEGFFFDSDQAIVGLMAKHLSAFKTFPLHYYGQNYMLGVQAWIIAPVFWVVRPSVAAMRAPLIALNILVVVWLFAILHRRLGLRPVVALVALLPLLMPTPAVGTELLDASGASIETLVYVLLLWQLRHRPFAYGILLAVAFLHREFMAAAAVALLVAEAIAGERPWANPRRIGWAIAGFGLAWLVVDDVKMHLSGVAQSTQMASLGNSICIDGESTNRVVALFREALPTVYGARPMVMQWFRMNSPIHTGWTINHLLIILLGGVMVMGTGFRSRPPRSPEAGGNPSPFPAYLVLTGVFAACVYPLSCNVALGYPPLLRYLLLPLLIPVGLFTAFARRQPRPWLLTTVVAGFGLWTALNVVDNVRVAAYALRNPPVSEHRVLVNYLESQRIRYAAAIYWDAYVLDFLSRERVTVGSLDTFRIPEYQQAIEAHRSDVVYLERLPCTGYATVASWCLNR